MSDSTSPYKPEPYWSEVAREIKRRGNGNVIAGDDEPYYHYKRQRFLELLYELNLEGKNVLEVGCGPGGNLLELLKLKPARLTGVDISQDMLDLAKQNTAGNQLDLVKVDGKALPFEDNTFDLVMTATVLQHNTDDAMFRRTLREICRVSKNQVVLFERVEDTIKGDDLCMGRPVDYFGGICAERNFKLKEVSFVNIQASYLMAGAIRKGLNPSNRKEGEPLNKLSLGLQNGLLPLTKALDKVFTTNRDLARMIFEKA